MTKTTIIHLLLLLPTTLIGQVKTEKLYFNENMKRCDSIYAKFIEIYTYYDTTNNKGDIKVISITGDLISACQYSNLKLFKKEGISLSYHKNGKLKSKINYIDDRLHGELTTYYANGKLKRKDRYVNDILISGNCYTINGEDTTYYNYEIKPEYPGGEEGLMKFVSSNLNYPDEAKEKKIQGKVFVQFIINKNGEIEDPIILKSAHPILDNEALRTIKLMERWSPGFQDGETVKVSFQLPINFRLYE